MKRLLIFVVLSSIAFAFWQCTPDSPRDEYKTVILPVTSVDLPAKCRVDSISIFTLHYKKPTTCHLFNGFYYDKSDMTRIVAVSTLQVLNASCLTDGTTVTADLKFKPIAAGDYTFKFWLGPDPQGNDTFFTQNVTVLP